MSKTESEIAQQASAISRQTMSPFCPGRTLADCPSPNAAEWRQEIATMLAAGKAPGEIQAELEARAARDLSGIPHHDIGYGFPLAVTLLFAAVLGALLWILRRKPPRVPAAVGAAPADPAESSTVGGVDDGRLEQELDELR